ncbi:MAG: hypothetical protein JNK46_10755 [Methylobacteriaceae bacterium]|nr:hypothetical protein [Methylobacteriaceae bacterium]
MGQSLDLVLDEAVRDGAIADGEVRAVRRALYGEGAPVGEAMRLLWEADKKRKAHSPEWSALFVEAALDVAIRETPPHGYFPADKAQKVIEALGEKTEARVDTVLEALVSIIEKAQDVPTDFSAFVLRKLKNAVIYSDETTASGEKLTPGVIGLPELALIRRTVWGAGGEGLLAVSRAEAEALFDIADATAGAPNAPEWEEFFARAVGNYLIGATGRTPLSRQEAFSAWHTDYESDMVGMLGKMLAGAARTMRGQGIGEALNERSLSDRVALRIHAEEEARAAARDQAEKLTGEKADWLLERVRRNGLVSGPEAKLLQFVKREAILLSPELRKLVDEAA